MIGSFPLTLRGNICVIVLTASYQPAPQYVAPPPPAAYAPVPYQGKYTKTKEIKCGPNHNKRK